MNAKKILYFTMLAAACNAPAKEKKDTNKSGQESAKKTFAWLHGKWIIDYGDTKIYESWKQETPTLLSGEGYVVAGNDTVVREALQIQKIENVWVFIAKINDQNPVLFTSRQTPSDTKLVFENTEHDFPQRITYGSTETGNIYAVVEGNDKGENKKEEYNYQRQ